MIPGTYHWEDPAHLLESAEGFGRRTVALEIDTSVAPTVSVVVTATPSTPTTGAGGGGGSGGGATETILEFDAAQVSTAVGYSVTKSVTLDASSSVLVPLNGYVRLEAYTTYGCGMGRAWARMGVAWALDKPIGIDLQDARGARGWPLRGGPRPARARGLTGTRARPTTGVTVGWG